MSTDFRALCAELVDAWLKGDDIVSAMNRARAVLARWGKVAPPADGEVAELVAKLRRLAPQNPLGTADPTITRAADLLERQALVPVAVSERLPGAEDCAPWPQPSDNSGWCWMSRTIHGFYGSFAIWEQVSVVPTCREVYTHWLPAHALPLPEVGE